MSVQDRDIMKTLEASLQFMLMKAEAVGPEDLDINLKVRVTGSHSSIIVDNVNELCLKSVVPTGKVTQDSVRCECCRKFLKEVYSLSFIFSENEETTCKECGPVRRSGRKRSKKSYGSEVLVTDDTNEKTSFGQDKSKDKDKGIDVDDEKEKVTNVKEKEPILSDNTSSIQNDDASASKPVESLACEICEKSFFDENSFTDHLLEHSGTNSCKCAVCGGKFSSKYVLKKHMKRHIPEERRPYKCGVCNKGFTEAFYYRDHMKIHTQVNPFKCRECNKSYSSSTALRRHVRDHAIIKGKCGTTRGNKSNSESDLPHRPKETVMKDGVSKTINDNESNFDDELDDIAEDADDDSYDDDDDDDDDSNDKYVDHTYSDNSPTQLDISVQNDVQNIEHSKTQKNASPRQEHKCDTCGKVFLAKTSLLAHRKTHKSDGGFKCKMCSKEFSSEKLLEDHQARHSGDRPFPCDQCGKSFFNRQVMEKHSSKHVPRDQWKYECEVCEKKFSHSSFLCDHKWTHEAKKPHKCEKCGNSYANKQSLSRHILSHSSGTHVCTECSQRFVFAHRLKEHMYTHNGVMPFSCEKCGKGFKKHQIFKKHSRIHSNMKPFACEKCPKHFYAQHDLDIHTRVHSGERPFQCDICGRTYTTKSTLQHHVQSHSEEYNVLKSCNQCGKEFKGDRALARHLKTHQILEKNIICELCGKKFKTNKALWSHNQTHKGSKPHACKHCGKKFRSSFHCKNHMKIHTGENLFQCNFCKDWFTDMSYLEKVHPKYCKSKRVYCDLCGRGFVHIQALQSHLGLHSGQRPYGCDTCGRAFVRESALSEHMKRHREAGSHICRICQKAFNIAIDLKKHEDRHKRQMKSQLPNCVKPGYSEAHQEDLRTVVSAEISGESSVGIPPLAGPDTVIEEVQIVTDVDHFPSEHVVLATIDPSQIGQHGQYDGAFSEVYSSSLSLLQQDQQDHRQLILQQHHQKVHQQQQSHPVPDQSLDQSLVTLALVHENL